MGYTFDGPNKLIILTFGTSTVDAKDLYSRWKDWSLLSDNSKYFHAISVLGGDPLPGGRYLGTTYFIENGWKIRPYEGNHTLVLSGNLYSRDGSDPFVNTVGSFNVRIMLTVSNLVDTVNTGGGVGTADDVRDAVWSATNFASHGAGTSGTKLNDAGSAGDPWSVDLSVYGPGTAGYMMVDTNTVVNQIDGLTPTQSTMLLEMYNLLGLDPLKPLTVTNTSRSVTGITQTIVSDQNSTVVQRI